VPTEQAYISSATLAHLTPEIVLVAVATLIYVVGAFVSGRAVWTWVALTGLLVAAAALVWNGSDALTVAGPLLPDALGSYGRWLALLMGAGLVLLNTRASPQTRQPEIMGTLLILTAGVMLVAGAGEMVLLFLGLELVTIPTYVLLYLSRHNAASQESTVKYFFLSILAAAVFLYGLSFLYGIAGTTHLADVYQALAAAGDNGGEGAALNIPMLGGIALVLIFAGLAFKMAAVPFHFYAPDVYQGTSNPNAALLSVAPKIAGVVALIRVVVAAMPQMEESAWHIALILSVLTMTLGNVVALWQDNIRRLLAYSSIAHAGYMLIGVAVALAATGDGPDGIGATLLYLCVYVLATTGTFAALVFLGGRGRQIDGVDQLAGLARSHPLSAAAVAIFMFSLAGIPPLAGFWGKFTLFAGALGVEGAAGEMTLTAKWFIALAVIGVLNAAIAAAYYLRIIAVMYFRAPLKPPAGEGGLGAGLATLACAVLVLALGIYPGPLVSQSNTAGRAARASMSAPAANMARALPAIDAANSQHE